MSVVKLSWLEVGLIRLVHNGKVTVLRRHVYDKGVV